LISQSDDLIAVADEQHRRALVGHPADEGRDVSRLIVSMPESGSSKIASFGCIA